MKRGEVQPRQAVLFGMKGGAQREAGGGSEGLATLLAPQMSTHQPTSTSSARVG
jgi:hypothetical protein